MTVRREHGERDRYLRGPDENDEPGNGCRCAACRAANTQAGRDRRRAIAYGRHHPWVDARRAREHLRARAAAGMPVNQAAALAGLRTAVVTQVLYGRPGQPPARRIRPETEARILAVRGGSDALAHLARVDATGTRRRLQALVAVGNSVSELGRHLGLEATRTSRLMRRDHVTAATARTVRALYDELWDVAPDESTPRASRAVSDARKLAADRGWPPPQAWDDDQIDDPRATPADGWKRPKRRSSADLAAEAAEVIALTGVSRELAAGRLGVTRYALEKAISRAGQAS